MASFGERLKYLREKKGISQEELGRRFNLSQSTIAYYESNKKQPSQSTLNKMADFFEQTTDYLLGRDNRSKQEQLSSIDSYINEAKEKYGDNAEVERMKVVREILENIIDLPEEDQKRINDFAERLKK